MGSAATCLFANYLQISRGGGDHYGNLVAACSDCNGRKADRTPEEADMPLLWVPRAPRTDQKRQQAIWRELTPTT